MANAEGIWSSSKPNLLVCTALLVMKHSHCHKMVTSSCIRNSSAHWMNLSYFSGQLEQEEKWAFMLKLHSCLIFMLICISDFLWGCVNANCFISLFLLFYFLFNIYSVSTLCWTYFILYLRMFGCKLFQLTLSTFLLCVEHIIFCIYFGLNILYSVFALCWTYFILYLISIFCNFFVLDICFCSVSVT